jgi:hypothetical protein
LLARFAQRFCSFLERTIDVGKPLSLNNSTGATQQNDSYITGKSGHFRVRREPSLRLTGRQRSFEAPNANGARSLQNIADGIQELLLAIDDLLQFAGAQAFRPRELANRLGDAVHDGRNGTGVCCADGVSVGRCWSGTGEGYSANGDGDQESSGQSVHVEAISLRSVADSEMLDISI